MQHPLADLLAIGHDHRLRLAAGFVVAILAIQLVAFGCSQDAPSAAPTRDGKNAVFPAEFPMDFPVFPDSAFARAFRTEDAALNGLTVVWHTSATVEDVEAFFATAFEVPPWQAPGVTHTGTSLVWTVVHTEDEDRQAIVTIAENAASDVTEIFVLLGDFGGDESGTPVPLD